jgi:uncharacterized protein YbaP (TraB family)
VYARVPHRTLLVALLVLCAACAVAKGTHQTPAAPAPSAEAAAPSHAFLWEATRPGAAERPLYLAGSVHVGQPRQFVFPPSMEAAFERAGTLVVEVDTASTDKEELQSLVAGLGVLPPGDGLSAHLRPETRKLLPEVLPQLGLDTVSVERMRPWLLSITLAALEMQKAGYAESGGIDRLLLDRARGKKTIVSLETAESQLRVLATLPDDVQDLMLRDQLKQSGMVSIALARMATAWEGGNPDAMADVVFERADDPVFRPLYERLFYERNRQMADRLVALAGASDVHFAIVGAAHLVGDQGLPTLLAKRGFDVRQMPRAR